MHRTLRWEDDGTRDGCHFGSGMTQPLPDGTARLAEPVIEVSGPHDRRRAQGLAAIDALLAVPRTERHRIRSVNHPAILKVHP